MIHGFACGSTDGRGVDAQVKQRRAADFKAGARWNEKLRRQAPRRRS
jgi:hypothetical protein